jgi:hypothetical protein
VIRTSSSARLYSTPAHTRTSFEAHRNRFTLQFNHSTYAANVSFLLATHRTVPHGCTSIVDSASSSEEVDLLHVDPSDALIETLDRQLVTHPVRPNSSATSVAETRIVSFASALHPHFTFWTMTDDGEWVTRDIPHHRVHDNGKLAAWMGVDGALHVFFQDPSQRLVYFAATWNYTIALPGSPKVGSPIFASAFEAEMYVFYISAMDHRIHC